MVILAGLAWIARMAVVAIVEEATSRSNVPIARRLISSMQSAGSLKPMQQLTSELEVCQDKQLKI